MSTNLSGFGTVSPIVFLPFGLNMSFPRPPECSSSTQVLMLSVGSDRHLPLAHNTFYITFTSLWYDVGSRDLECIP